MMYLALIPFAVLGIWFLGKMSKPACALSGLVGVIAMMIGSMGGSLSMTLFGIGLFLFSTLIFFAFNWGNW